MDSHDLRTRSLAVAASAAAAALWAVLAWRTPTSTFHFAPMVAVAVGPYLAKARNGRKRLASAAATVGLCALAVGTAATILAVADRLQGPTFWADDGALTESLLFIGLGAAIGVANLAALGASSRTATGDT